MEPNNLTQENLTNLTETNYDTPSSKGYHTLKILIISLFVSAPIFIKIGNHFHENKKINDLVLMISPFIFILIPTSVILVLTVSVFFKKVALDENKPSFYILRKIISIIGLIIFSFSWLISGFLFITGALSNHSPVANIVVYFPIIMLVFYLITNIGIFKKYTFITYLLPFVYLFIIFVSYITQAF